MRKGKMTNILPAPSSSFSSDVVILSLANVEDFATDG
jgi:hypothetical protein